MLQQLTFKRQASHPDGQLVRNNDGLGPVPALLVRGAGGVLNGLSHAAHLHNVRLAPGWAQRVVQFRPVARVVQKLLPVHVQALKIVIGLNHARIGVRLKPQKLSDRLSRLAGAGQRGAYQVHNVRTFAPTPGKLLGAHAHHLLPLLRKVVVG